MSVDAPKLKLLSPPAETLCYHHLQQTHRGADGGAHRVSPAPLSSSSSSSSPFSSPVDFVVAGSEFDHSAGVQMGGEPSQKPRWSHVGESFRLSPPMLKVQSYTRNKHSDNLDLIHR